MANLGRYKKVSVQVDGSGCCNKVSAQVDGSGCCNKVRAQLDAPSVCECTVTRLEMIEKFLKFRKWAADLQTFKNRKHTVCSLGMNVKDKNCSIMHTNMV